MIKSRISYDSRIQNCRSLYKTRLEFARVPSCHSLATAHNSKTDTLLSFLLVAAISRAGPAVAVLLRRRSATSEKPVYTHNRIKQLYDQHRRGAYAGREAEWALMNICYGKS